jgi:hypothetical protein
VHGLVVIDVKTGSGSSLDAEDILVLTFVGILFLIITMPCLGILTGGMI